MFITPSFKKSLIVEQFQGNYLKPEDEPVKGTESLEIIPKKELNELLANFWPNAKKQNGDSYKDIFS